MTQLGIDRKLQEIRRILSSFRRLAKSHSRLDYKKVIFELERKEADLISRIGKSAN